MAEIFLGLIAHMRQELSPLDQGIRWGGRALGAQAALSEVRREAGEGPPCQARARLDLVVPWVLGTRDGFRGGRADCGRLGRR